MDLTVKDILSKLFQDHVYEKQVKLCVANSFYWDKHFESDFISISKAGYVSEYEIKMTRADFKNDFKKFHGKEYKKWQLDLFEKRGIEQQKYYKHDLLKNGKSGIKHFYFCCPEGLLTKEDLPDHVGLLEFSVPNNKWHEFATYKTTKRAPKLPNAQKASEEDELRIREAQKWQYVKSKMIKFERVS